jgi:thioredoxin-dependent peroxiredoxin
MIVLTQLFGPPLPVGNKAPDFSLPDQDGNPVQLAALRGKYVVLVFYPADHTPTCTKQLCEFRDAWHTVTRPDLAIFGINPHSPKSHANFREKLGLPFPLLVDANSRVAALYRAAGLWTRRTVYVIGPDGVIRYAQRGKPAPEEVLQAVG